MRSALGVLLASLVSMETIQSIGWLLMHSLWQFAALAVVAAIVERLMRRDSASARYLMLTGFMLLMVLAPLATWFALPGPEGSPMAATPTSPDPLVAPSSDALESHDRVAVAARPRGALRPNHSDSVAEPATAASPATPAAPAFWWWRAADAVRPWLQWIVAGWSLGVLVFSLRLLLGWYTVRRLRTVCVAAVDASVRQALARLQQSLAVRRPVEVLQSTLVLTPLVVGSFRGVILLPVSLVSGLPPAQLDAILAHELAHVKRYDYLVNLLQSLIEALFFYHPAIWWLSHRVRTERENCCDDLVVAVLGDRVQYGRALLAVEENRGMASALALGVRDGSLLGRVRRLAGISDVDLRLRRGGLIGAAGAGLASAGVLWTVAFGLAATGGDTVAGFGVESSGLRCRLVAVAPDVNDDAPELSRTSRSFARSADMTFAVELKNVSGNAVTLAGVRYGEGYADNVRGTLRTEWLAPHWFEFEFADLDGNPVPRTHREFHQGWHVAHNASLQELAPGKSLVFVLRPAAFQVPMDHDLPAGNYQVRVRYRGPNESLRRNVRQHWPDAAILNAWSHEVVSNSVEFSIQEDSLRARPEDLVWGQEHDGLQAALEYQVPDEVTGSPLSAPGVPVGTALGVVFHLRNVSDHVITFVSETGRQGDNVRITNDRGEAVEVEDVWFSGWPVDVAWRLQPGETARLHVLAPAINRLDQPGRYTVRYTVRFNSRSQKDESGHVLFPRPGDYDQQLETGDTPLFLCEAKREVSANGETQSQSPFRLPDHWIVVDACFVNDDQEIVTVSIQGGVNVRRWDVATKELKSEIKLEGDKHGWTFRQNTLQLSADGRRVLAATDEYVGVWDAATGDLLKMLPIPKKQWEYDRVRCLDCSADGSIIVAGLGTSHSRSTLSYDSYGIVWDAATGGVKQMVTHPGGYYFADVAVTSDGSYFATCNENGRSVGLWDVGSGRLLRDFSPAIADWKNSDPELIQNNLVNAVAFSPDGSRLAVSGTFGVKLFDTASGDPWLGIDAPYRFGSGSSGLAFSADGRQLARFGAARGERDYSVPIWSTESGEMLFDLPTPANSGAFAKSKNGQSFAVVGSDFHEALSIWPVNGS